MLSSSTDTSNTTPETDRFIRQHGSNNNNVKNVKLQQPKVVVVNVTQKNVSSTSSSSSSYQWIQNKYLLMIILLQWIFFTILINERYDHESKIVSRFIELESKLKSQKRYKDITTSSSSSSHKKEYYPDYFTEQEQQQNDVRNEEEVEENENDDSNNNNNNVDVDEVIDGVFVTIMLRSPRWFHLRYKVMLDNALSNLPLPFESTTTARTVTTSSRSRRVLNETDPMNDTAASGTGKKKKNWKVQVFINEEWAQKELYPWHPGLERMLLHHPQIIKTIIPDNLNSTSTSTSTSMKTTKSVQKIKPKDLLYSKWFWETIVADPIVLFSGNGAFCGNHIIDPYLYYQQILINQVDYCGTPWHSYHGRGGDGSTHSYRNRKAMLRVIEYYQQNPNKINNKNTEYKNTIQAMLTMNEEYLMKQQQQQSNVSVDGSNHSNNETMDNNLSMFRLASVEQTIQFGGVLNLSSSSNSNSTDVSTSGRLQHLPIVVSGTLPNLLYDERDTILKHCPELKIIFPTLHEPNCFGSNPKPNQCKASICALQDTIPSHGC